MAFGIIVSKKAKGRRLSLCRSVEDGLICKIEEKEKGAETICTISLDLFANFCCFLRLSNINQ